MADEVLLIWRQVLPVRVIVAKVHLFSCRESTARMSRGPHMGRQAAEFEAEQSIWLAIALESYH